jgi:hypothetical protein
LYGIIAVVAKILFILKGDSEIISHNLCVALQFDALGSPQLEIGCRSEEDLFSSQAAII